MIAIAVAILAMQVPAAGQAPAAGDAPAIEPAALFATLAERYRQLAVYEDAADVEQVTEPPGGEARRHELRIACRLEGGRLRITTPGSQVLEGAGLEDSQDLSPALRELTERYNLWLAPHMVLHCAEQPLRTFRAGVPEGFVPIEAEPVELEGRSLIRLRLESPVAADAGRPPTARFDLWIEPKSMLIERIEGTQRLPDGSTYRTTLEIKAEIKRS